jgi:hypothetical protein
MSYLDKILALVFNSLKIYYNYYFILLLLIIVRIISIKFLFLFCNIILKFIKY